MLGGLGTDRNQENGVTSEKLHVMGAAGKYHDSLTSEIQKQFYTFHQTDIIPIPDVDRGQN